MSSQYIVISPDTVLRIRPHLSRRQQALRALLPKAAGLLVGSLYFLTVLMNA